LKYASYDDDDDEPTVHRTFIDTLKNPTIH
jgi:hypothetical protein